MHRQPNRCPVCDGTFYISELTCSECGSVLRGEFGTSRFNRLDKEQTHFLEVFLRSRGVLSGVEKELSISYPTVRSRLDALLTALGLAPAAAQAEAQAAEDKAKKRQEILDRLYKGEISADEAKEALKETR